MELSVKKRLAVVGVAVVLALLFLYPTIRIGVKRYLGQEVTSAELLGGDWISRPISLGLDLSGGVHLVYEVQSGEAVRARMQSIANSLRNELRDREKVAVTRAQVNRDGDIEITLLSDLLVERARQFIERERTGLVFRGEGRDGDRPILRYGIPEREAEEIEMTAVSQALETLRSRIDQFGVAEPLLQRVGERRIMLQMPGIDDIEAVKDVVGRVAQLEFRLLPAPGSSVGSVTLREQGTGAPIEVEDVVQLTGDAVRDARVGFDSSRGLEVLLSFTPDGGRAFANLTGRNVGRNLAIILDGEVYSSPVINERIGGGQSSITGRFSPEEARLLAVVLRAGALPASLEVLQERTVGPTLGRESIRRGVTAILLGFALVVVFMVVYYRKAGAVAATLLVLNVLFVLAALSAFGATLTLPGLVGLALTVGMAVDANVIIFERIREELRNGVGRDPAVAGGFDKAFSAIVDSNVTTLLAGIILFWFGTGPIRGFAVTLSIGIFSTLFCATFVGRLAFDALSLKGKKGLSIWG